MRVRRLPLGLLVPIALVVLVGALATLQYRWLGRVSEAERDRLDAALRQRAEEFADEFDREILHLYLSISLDDRMIRESNWESLGKSLDAWRVSAKYPELLRALYLVDTHELDTSLRQYDTASRSFAPAPWPDTLTPVKTRLADVGRPSVGTWTSIGRGRAGSNERYADLMVQASGTAHRFVALHDPVVGAVPALVVVVPTVETPAGPDRRTATTVQRSASCLVVELDRKYLESTVLPALAARHFPERGSDRYVFAVVRSEDRSDVMFARGLTTGETIDPLKADARVPLMAVRFELAPQIISHALATGSAPNLQMLRVPPPKPATGTQSQTAVRESQFSIVLSARGAAAGPDVMRMTTRPIGTAAWQLVIRHSAGSLDAAVAQARRRNLWLSFGILTVLAASVGLIVINARRSERLAAQQMDFVATVSHELRTPVAVIRSAAQNLSAGVVTDSAQARRYGDLIETEGKRLTDMVEQVLEYAGLSDIRRAMLRRPVDVGSLVRDVAASCSSLAGAEGFEVAVHVADDVPIVMADEGALRRAIDNLVTNALKHGRDGRWLEIRVGRAARTEREVEVSVSDRGRGIAADDLAHIFEPFYRGRHALDRQIHGNGLGLSLVKRIAEAHGGRVTVTSAPGAGATFTLHLPAGEAGRLAFDAETPEHDSPGRFSPA